MPAITPAVINQLIQQARDKIAAGSKKVPIQFGDGLLLVVTKSSTAWVSRWRAGGKLVDKTVGHYPSMPLREARVAAIEGVGKPSAPRAADAPPASERGSVVAMVDQWLASLTDKSAIYRTNIRRAMDADVIPAIGSAAPHEVERSDVDAILRAIEARGSFVMLRRVRLWLNLMWAWAIDHESWPAVEASPVRVGKLRSFKTAPKGHFPAITNAAEVPELMRAVRLTNSTITRHALLLAAYTFQRPTELSAAVWSEFDLDGAKWVIPAARMKKEREHWVPLSRQVVALLRLHKSLTGGGFWLFPGTVAGQPISDATMLKRIKDAGFNGRHTTHGFRAMGRTIGEEVLGIDAKVLEKQLSHEPKDALRGAYNRAEYWSQRVEAAQRWANWLDTQV